MQTFNPVSPQEAVAHLQPAVWARVNRLHLRKILAEFAHEQIIQPALQETADGWGHYVLAAGTADTSYHFRARILHLHHWYIDAGSIEKRAQGRPAPLDSLAFITEFSDQLGIAPELLPQYMEEVCSTLYGSAYIQAQEGPSAAYLAQAGYQEIEHAMTGHPRFIANNGRIGFDATDYRAFAPEAATPLQLAWLAGHRSCTEFTCADTLTCNAVMEQELGAATVAAFRQLLQEKGLDPAAYFFMPVHPWQWYNKLAGIFAPDIAAGRLVFLGYGADAYLPQQSIRTFFNTDNPQKFYVKTALSILNMGYMRGLSPYFMRTTPVINEWVHGLVEQDAYLQSTGFCTLREIATTAYTHQHFETAVKTDSPYKKMLAALWRESPLSRVQPGQRLMTMAALLHVDTEGKALLPELVRLSGLSTDEWLARYFHCYLSPLLHCFYQYDMVFMPHGENLILVLDNYAPVRAIMKDIGEEVSVLNPDTDMPEAARRLLANVTEEARTRPLFTQVFDGIFRFIAAILEEQEGYPEARFWELVAACIHRYRQEHPQLAEKMERYDLFAPTISTDALNRLQISNNKQLRDRSNPFAVPSVGILQNPVAAYRSRIAPAHVEA
ncbi:IucA/IucC family protein [Chitinophaga japonensis]|uniref:Siderophore synthetase component n=1 Tax=Chitinophaga japonensis TaxID=104662 RepID=A0A562T0E6_CHIJA|nr:IucA/IucC family siderophore biosynthesis protein [Chitinophaga japonensis]TWI86734.1 siderophore synthetase component [Chitinophaga japonensis]